MATKKGRKEAFSISTSSFSPSSFLEWVEDTFLLPSSLPPQTEIESLAGGSAHTHTKSEKDGEGGGLKDQAGQTICQPSREERERKRNPSFCRWEATAAAAATSNLVTAHSLTIPPSLPLLPLLPQRATAKKKEEKAVLKVASRSFLSFSC